MNDTILPNNLPMQIKLFLYQIYRCVENVCNFRTGYIVNKYELFLLTAFEIKTYNKLLFIKK